MQCYKQPTYVNPRECAMKPPTPPDTNGFDPCYEPPKPYQPPNECSIGGRFHAEVFVKECFTPRPVPNYPFLPSTDCTYSPNVGYKCPYHSGPGM